MSLIIMMVIIVIIYLIICSCFDSSSAQVTATPERNLSAMSRADNVRAACAGFSLDDEDMAAMLQMA